MMGGTLGLLLALWGARLLMALVSASSLNPPGIWVHSLIGVLLSFTAGVSILTGGYSVLLRASWFRHRPDIVA